MTTGRLSMLKNLWISERSLEYKQMNKALKSCALGYQ